MTDEAVFTGINPDDDGPGRGDTRALPPVSYRIAGESVSSTVSPDSSSRDVGRAFLYARVKPRTASAYLVVPFNRATYARRRANRKANALWAAAGATRVQAGPTSDGPATSRSYISHATFHVQRAE